LVARTAKALQLAVTAAVILLLCGDGSVTTKQQIQVTAKEILMSPLAEHSTRSLLLSLFTA
jgi:hypothetical protein